MLNQRSLRNLESVHPHLAAIIEHADEILPKYEKDLSFQVTQGARSLAEQKRLVANGASRTLNSRHIPAENGYAHAADIAVSIGGRLSWEPLLYKRVSDVVKRAAQELGYPVEWGGDWKSFYDGPHFQLPYDSYTGSASPAGTPATQPSENELRTLVFGSRGDLVIRLQHALNRHGAEIGVDGDFRSNTYDAVKAFQKRHGLKDDGIVGPATWKALGHGRDLEKDARQSEIAARR